MASSDLYGFLSDKGSGSLYFQPSIQSAYGLRIENSEVFPGGLGVCFMRTVSWPESRFFLADIRDCYPPLGVEPVRVGVEPVPYLSYESSEDRYVLRDPTSQMCLGQEKGGKGAILSDAACKTGSFLLIPSNN